MRSLQKTPPRMVEPDGSLHFGSFRTPFKEVNILDAPLYRWRAPRFWKNFRLKEWQHFGLITPTHYFGMVIFNAKFTGVSFFYVYDRQTGTRIEHVRQSPGRLTKVAGQVYDDFCLFEAKGYRIRFDNKVDAGYHRLFIDIEGDQNLPSVRGDVTLYEDLDLIEPLVQFSPITAARPFYTHKAAMQASGSIRLGAQEIVIEKSTGIGLLDEQKTFYPYTSFWKWATAAGYGDDGSLLAFNLCHNMIADDEDYNENCFWKNGKITHLKAARFDYGDVMQAWNIKTTDSKVELSFLPEGKRADRLSMVGGLLLSDFHQPFGLYSGRIRDAQGVDYAVSNFFGLAEHHVTRY